jgi:ATP-dependent RNA helicase DHX8/PRP22
MPHLPRLEVLPLHATLPVEEQTRVFAPAVRGVRRLIVATNIAETSVTLPHVRVVIDAGQVKEKHYANDKGMEVLSVVPISQSAATQRAGRAGRTAAGTVWRLYTEAQFKSMPAAPAPEIRRCNLANVVLGLKRMGLKELHAVDWLDPPEPAALRQAPLDTQWGRGLQKRRVAAS